MRLVTLIKNKDFARQVGKLARQNPECVIQRSLKNQFLNTAADEYWTDQLTVIAGSAGLDRARVIYLASGDETAPELTSIQGVTIAYDISEDMKARVLGPNAKDSKEPSDMNPTTDTILSKERAAEFLKGTKSIMEQKLQTQPPSPSKPKLDFKNIQDSGEQHWTEIPSEILGDTGVSDEFKRILLKQANEADGIRKPITSIKESAIQVEEPVLEIILRRDDTGVDTVIPTNKSVPAVEFEEPLVPIDAEFVQVVVEGPPSVESEVETPAKEIISDSDQSADTLSVEVEAKTGAVSHIEATNEDILESVPETVAVAGLSSSAEVSDTGTQPEIGLEIQETESPDVPVDSTSNSTEVVESISAPDSNVLPAEDSGSIPEIPDTDGWNTDIVEQTVPEEIPPQKETPAEPSPPPLIEMVSDSKDSELAEPDMELASEDTEVPVECDDSDARDVGVHIAFQEEWDITAATDTDISASGGSWDNSEVFTSTIDAPRRPTPSSRDDASEGIHQIGSSKLDIDIEPMTENTTEFYFDMEATALTQPNRSMSIPVPRVPNAGRSAPIRSQSTPVQEYREKNRESLGKSIASITPVSKSQTLALPSTKSRPAPRVKLQNGKRRLAGVTIFGNAAKGGGAGNLAYNFACDCNELSGKDVVLLDLDFSSAGLTRSVYTKFKLDITDNCGIENVLSVTSQQFAEEKHMLMSGIVTGSGNFSFIRSNPAYPIQVKKIFEAANFAKMIEVLRLEFDVVILDIGSFSKDTACIKQLSRAGYKMVLTYDCRTRKQILDSSNTLATMPINCDLVLTNYNLVVNPIEIEQLTHHKVIGILEPRDSPPKGELTRYSQMGTKTKESWDAIYSKLTGVI